ncbi:MAG: IclR family transcriptional regulator [Gulosibacter sp.]|uniref:IclR family transcriptional regulator n=1 Tax=Gulosibacter sp. TaxID=2817531 RepID=UPI003F915E03
MNESSASLVVKIAAILRTVADYGQNGARLVDIASESGVVRPTAHRILGNLAREELITQRPDRKYALGPLAFRLGLSAPFPLGDIDAIQAIVQDLADYTTVTCYVGILMRRRVLYVARAQGSSPVHVYSVEVGETRPLTTTHAGIALLSGIPAEDQDLILAPDALERTRKQLDVPLVLDASTIREKMHQVEMNGYFYGHDLTSPGIAGMAAPVPVSSGPPFIAVTISSINAHLPSETADRLAPRLLQAAAEISRSVANSGGSFASSTAALPTQSR